MLRVQTSLFGCAGDCMIRDMKEQRDKIWSRGGWKEITNGWCQNDEKSKQLQQNLQISAVWWPPGRILRPVAGHIPLGRHQPGWDPAAGILPGLLRILPGHHNQPCLLVRRWVCVYTTLNSQLKISSSLEYCNHKLDQVFENFTTDQQLFVLHKYLDETA